MKNNFIPSFVLIALYTIIQVSGYFITRNAAALPIASKSIPAPGTVSSSSSSFLHHLRVLPVKEATMARKPSRKKISIKKPDKSILVKETKNESATTNTKNYFPSFFQDAPAEKYQVPFVGFKRNANMSTEFVYLRTGTLVKVPANAFINKSGVLVGGEVEIRYREFIKPSEIFTSGIPMHLQGDDYLESAGMLQLEAWQNGEKLELAENKYVEITMSSTFTDRDYNLYAFNDNEQKWLLKGNDFSYAQPAADVASSDDAWKKVPDDSLPEYINVKQEYTIPADRIIGFTPSYVEDFNKKESVVYRQAKLHLVFENAQFPDLAFLGNYDYKIYSHNYSELSALANAYMDKEKGVSLGWKDLFIQYPGTKGLVDLKFINNLDTFVVGAEPLFENARYRKKYLDQYYQYAASYETARQGRLYIKKSRMIQRKLDLEKDTLIIKEIKTARVNAKIERQFLVDKLMTWNCDRPFPLRPYEIVMVSITQSLVQNISAVYAAVPGKNSVFRATDFKKFTLVDKGNMYVWALLDEHTVGYLTPNMLKAVVWDYKNVNDLRLQVMSLDQFLPMLDREILSNKEKLTEFIS